jgi:hypothetical protein
MTALANRIRGLLATAVLGGTLLGALGCGESVIYAYFAVDVTIDESANFDFLNRISSCSVVVEGPRQDQGNLNCIKGAIKDHRLGKFEYSTSASSGSVRFTVVLRDLNGRELARGTSDSVRIVPDELVNASVLVKPLPEALEPRR